MPINLSCSIHGVVFGEADAVGCDHTMMDPGSRRPVAAPMLSMAMMERPVGFIVVLFKAGNDLHAVRQHVG